MYVRRGEPEVNFCQGLKGTQLRSWEDIETLGCMKMALLNEKNNSFNECDVFINTNIIDFPPVTKSTGWRISIAVLLLFLSLFHLFTVLYLSLVLKKRAWDSPAKRFGCFFNLYIALTVLFFTIVLFSTKSMYYINIAVMIVRYPIIVAFLNFAALLVALSLQLVAPFLPERVKKQCESRPRCVMSTEVVIQVLFLLIMILIPTFSWVFCYNYNHITLLIVVCFSTIISFLSFTMLIFTYIKFFKNSNVNKSIKYVILKFAFVIIICILLIITVIYSKDLFLYMLSFFFLTLSSSLNSPLYIWCYICYLRRFQESRVPLLPINDTERQQTNPLSVWDHTNVPSYTATNLPFDMSDCRSDYRSIKSFSVLTPSAQYR